MPPMIRNSALLVAAMATVWSAASHTLADDTPAELWMVSTRCAPRSCFAETGNADFRYYRRGDDKHWGRTSADALFDSLATPIPTTVFVHGNRADFSAAIADGVCLQRVIRRQAHGQPFRLVIWSWPSDRICGTQRNDVRVKAAYSDVQGYYLAGFLRRIDSEVPVGLVGYSFGARVVTVALHLLDGGRLNGNSLPAPDAEDTAAEASAEDAPETMAAEPADLPRRRAVLIAAAADAHWLAPGQRNGRALAQVDRLLVTRNASDPVLRLYPLMYCLGGPQALGHTGPVCSCADRDKVKGIDVTCAVGRAHDWARYMAACGLQRRLAEYTFLDSEEADAEPAAQEIPAAAP